MRNPFDFIDAIERGRLCLENMALTLTEDLIRNRVGLEHDNLGKTFPCPGK